MPELTQPDCKACGTTLCCPDCDDPRPTAGRVAAGWRLRTPFGRWETIERVEQPNEFAPVLIWTKETGVQVPWQYPRWRHLDVREPEGSAHGVPEIRVVGYEGRDGPIIAVATTSTRHDDVPGAATLVSANYARGEGWMVSHRPVPGVPQGPTIFAAKSAARSEVHRLARQYAKKMGVKVNITKNEGHR